MERNYKKTVYIMLLKLLHIAVSVIGFYFAWSFFRYGAIRFGGDKGFRYNYYISAMYSVFLVFLSRTYNAYLLGYSRTRALAFSQLLSQAVSTAATFFLTAIAWNKWKFPAPLFILIAFLGVFDCLWSYLANRYYYQLNPTKRAVLLCKNETDARRFGSIEGLPFERMYRIEKTVYCASSDENEVIDLIAGFDAVFVSGLDSDIRNSVAKYCVATDTPGYFLPHVGDIIMQGSKHIQTFTTPVLHTQRKELEPEYRAIKRLFDVFASLIAIVITSPFMLITAVMIKIYDGGPVFYKQVRLTKNGREFKILKFRSMRVDAEKDGVARLSAGDKDERITPVGRIIRACRMDELPQLFNILKGDMSIVGPRPERPEIAERYYQALPDFRLRLQVKAGLTGYAQVYGKYNTSPREKLEFDLLYINHMSILTDLQLMFATVGILFKKESTEGVEDSKLWLTDN